MTALIKRIVRAGTGFRGASTPPSAAIADRGTKPLSARRLDSLATDWNSAILSYDNFR